MRKVISVELKDQTFTGCSSGLIMDPILVGLLKGEPEEVHIRLGPTPNVSR